MWKIPGNERAKQCAEAIELMLEDYGLEQRFRLEGVSASEGPKFAQVMKEMVQGVKGVGPSTFRQS